MKCSRLEHEDLLGSLGERMDPHVDECPDCRARLPEYRRLAAMLARESPRRPPSGWKERALARLHAERRSARRRRLIATTSVLAAAAVAWWLWPRDAPPTFAVDVQHAPDEEWLGDDPIHGHVGDFLHATVKGGAAEHDELRIYRERRALRARCPGDPAPACKRSGKTLTVHRLLSEMGEYQVIWLSSSSPLPAPGGDLDSDLGAARAAGAIIEGSEAVHVD